MSAQTRNIVVGPPVPPGGWATKSGVVIAELSEEVTDSSAPGQQAKWDTRRRMAPVDPGSGTAVLTLVCNDDPSIEPAGSTWKIWWVVDGQASTPAPYVISTSLAATVNLSSLTPAASTNPTPGGGSHGTLAARPAATGSGTIYFATDDGGIGTAWLDSAPGVWTPLAPGEIAYAQNVTGTTTPVSSAAQTADIPGCSIVVPACSRPVWIRYKASPHQTVAGTGTLFLQLNETTSGSSTIDEVNVPLPNSVTQWANYPPPLLGEYRLGATVAQRTFKLTLQVFPVSGQTPTVEALNAAALSSWICAETR